MGLFSKIISKIFKTYTKEPEESFDDFIDEQDSQEEYAEQEEIYLQHIREIIDQIKPFYPNAGLWFETLLDSQIAKYGAKAVAEGLDGFDENELLMLVVTAFYDPDGNYGSRALATLLMAITSEIPTEEDLKYAEDLMERDRWV